MGAAHRSDGERIDYGRLANNYMSVQGLQASLSRGEMNARLIPGLVASIIEEEAWREWFDTNNGAHRTRWKLANPADFREFIRTPRPEGCECPLHVFERMIRDTPAWEPYQKLVRGEPGNPEWEGQPRTDDGSFMGRNRDIVTVSPDDGSPMGREDESSPDTIPFESPSPSAPAPAPRKRDYKREAPTGNSVSYMLRQLERGRGEKPARPDLLARVRAGEISAHAACVLAGYIEKAITVPADPRSAARRLALHFDTAQLADLMDAINEILKARA